MKIEITADNRYIIRNASVGCPMTITSTPKSTRYAAIRAAEIKCDHLRRLGWAD